MSLNNTVGTLKSSTLTVSGTATVPANTYDTVVFTGASGTLTLPSVGSGQLGAVLTIRNTGTGPVTVSRAGTDVLAIGSVSSTVNSTTVGVNNSLSLVSGVAASVGTWYAVSALRAYQNVRATTGTTEQLVNTDQVVTCNNASAVAVTLPLVATVAAGFTITIKNLGAGLVTLASTATINGSGGTGQTIAQNKAATLVFDGTNWNTVSLVA